MSAFLSSPDAINALATYWELRASRPGEYTTPADSLHRAWSFSCRRRGVAENPSRADEQTGRLIAKLKPFEAVAAILLLENQRSLNARYPGDGDMAKAGAAYKPRRLPIVDFWLQSRKTGQMVGICRGYSYQACEHDEWEDSTAYQLIQQIELWLLRDLEARDCGDKHNWAGFEAPEDPRAVALRVALATA